MGAPLTYKGNVDLWVGNGIKDLFCDVVADQARLRGLDIFAIFGDEPAIAGCYGIGGMQIDLEAYLPYFGGMEEFFEHLSICEKNARAHCGDDGQRERMEAVFAWAQHKVRGGRILEMKNKAASQEIPDYHLIVDYDCEADLQDAFKEMKAIYKEDPHAPLMRMVSEFRVAFSKDADRGAEPDGPNPVPLRSKT